MSGRSGGALALLLACAGCAGPSFGVLGWEIELESEALLDRAVAFDAAIVEGGCDGEAVFTTRIERDVMATPMTPELHPGTWGFAATAQDADCVEFAGGCTEVEAPLVGPIVVLLEALPYDESAATCPAPAAVELPGGEVSP